MQRSLSTIAGSRASGDVISAKSSACRQAQADAVLSAVMLPARPATSVRAAAALDSSTLMTASTVTASCAGCQQSKSVTMPTLA